MQVVVSVAVVLLALGVVATDSVETESTFSERFEQFQQDVQAFMGQVEEKTKAAFQEFQRSEFSNKTRNWFTENFEKLKAKWKEAFSK